MQAAANKEIKAYISIHAPHARSDQTAMHTT